MRKPLISGNWKMNLDLGQADELLTRLDEQARSLEGIDVWIFPSSIYLHPLAANGRVKGIRIGAQNIHAGEGGKNSGAYTGEFSPVMLKSIGVDLSLIGHSERRHVFGEGDDLIALKVKTALDAGLHVILCIGETLQERETGKTFEVIERQVMSACESLSMKQLGTGITLAYEPVWAIGTGKTASDDQAQEVHAFIRGLLTSRFTDELARDMRILYGGSVKPANVRGLMTMPDIDGALVGGASLKAESFTEIMQYREEGL